MKLNEIFKNTNYGDSLFTDEEIAAIESRIKKRDGKEKQVAYITCLVRNKEVKLTPEEVMRQLYIYRLLDYGYPADRLQVEFGVHFGR
jgi:type I restriction enzyme M protein